MIIILAWIFEIFLFYSAIACLTYLWAYYSFADIEYLGINKWPPSKYCAIYWPICLPFMVGSFLLSTLLYLMDKKN